MFKTSLQIAALAAAALASQAHAAVVVQWDFETAVEPAASTAWAGIAASTGTGSASGVHAASATWSTPTGNGSANSASANAWAVGDYWQFSFSSTGFTGLNLSFDQTSSNTGPRDFTLAYSTNGSTFTNFASYAVLANATPNPTWSTGTYNAVYTLSYDLSAVTALNNQANVFLRLTNNSTVSANGGTVAGTGTSRVDNFTVNMTPVPEASTSAMLLAGLAVLGFLGRRRAAV
jgi:PEP-CTERM motif